MENVSKKRGLNWSDFIFCIEMDLLDFIPIAWLPGGGELIDVIQTAWMVWHFNDAWYLTDAIELGVPIIDAILPTATASWVLRNTVFTE